MHWNPYWKWRNDGGLSDSLLTDQPVVVPMATVAQPSAGGKDPTETQSNPLSSQEVIPTSSEAPGDGDAAAPWTLPEDRCCSSQFSVWGIASPQTHLQALRQQHESRHGTATDESTAPAEGAAATDPTERFFSPTVEGAAAFKQSLQQAHASEGKDLDKKQWARAGCTVACNWIRLHPTVASAILLMLSFWIGHGSNLFLPLFASWLFSRIYCAPLCGSCWCAPAGRFECKRTPADPPCCSRKCFGTCFGVFWACNFLLNPVSVMIMINGCQTSCELTGWQPGFNEMEQPLEELFAPEYFGLLHDFLDQSITQPCVLTGAIDQLIGPDGAVREALEENHRHWGFDIAETDGQIAQTKGWIERHGTTLRSAVATRCDTMSDDCLRGASCLAATCTADERCEQGSLLPTCVNATDACGCTSGGWSSSHQCCLETGSTSKREADACAAGSLGVPLGAACSDGHYDWCGCEPGSGWSSGGACCSPSSSSSASELETCRASIGRFATAPREGPKC